MNESINGVGTSTGLSDLLGILVLDVRLGLNSGSSEFLDHLNSDGSDLDGSDLDQSESQLGLSGSNGGSDLELELSLLGFKGDLLGAFLELSSELSESQTSSSDDGSSSPSTGFSSETDSPFIEFESSALNSVDDVLTTASSSLLDSDDGLLLVAPNKFGLKLGDFSLVLGLDLGDLLLIDSEAGFDLNSLDDVVPSDTLVLVVDVSVLDTLSSNSSDAVMAKIVGHVSGTGLDWLVGNMGLSVFRNLNLVFTVGNDVGDRCWNDWLEKSISPGDAETGAFLSPSHADLSGPLVSTNSSLLNALLLDLDGVVDLLNKI